MAGFLMLGMNPEQLNVTMQSPKTGETLEKNAGLCRRDRFLPDGQRSLWLWTRKLCSRGAFPSSDTSSFRAAITPGASDIIDGSKLPETETIAKHLQPIVYSQIRLPEGYLVESSGPITMNQAVLIAAAAGAAFFKPAAATR
jgi:hypothetical protein